jgi:hypothetical protein
MSEEVQAEAPPAEERDFVVAEDTQPERPEWLPEKYNSGEDLAKAYGELESKLGIKEQDFREKFIEEINAEAYKDRPESSGDYQLPDSIDEEVAIDNEVLKWWAETSFENGFGQEEFAKGIEMVVSAMSADVPDMEAEMKKLGDNASARIEAASLFSQQFFPKEHMDSIERLTETADGLMALEFIMSELKTVSVNGETAAPSQITPESLRALMQDERYWNAARRDMDYVKQVDDGWQKLAGS